MHVQDIPKNVNTQLEQLSWTCIVTIKCFVFAPPPPQDIIERYKSLNYFN